MSEQGSHLTDKGTEPFSTANIDDVLGSPMYWIEHIATTVSTDTPLPKSFEHDYSDVSRGLTKSLSLTSVSPSSLFSPTKGTTDNQTSISALQEDSGEKEAGRAEGVANFPRDESKGQGSFSSTFRPPATLSESSINPSSLDYIKTAIPLFKNMTRVQDGVKASVSGNLPNPLASSLARDSMLIYARRMFHMPPVPPGLDENARQERIKDVYRTQLLPLLRNLHSLHPRHIPILLLLGCVYYAIGDFAESLAVNNEILRIDEKFVEAMSNTGTTLKAMGRMEPAIECWWKAVYIRPTYWDAVNNLLGALVLQEQARFPSSRDRVYAEALRLCEVVRSRVLDSSGKRLLRVPPEEIHHFQNLLHVSGGIRCLQPQTSIVEGIADFLTSLEYLLHQAGAETKNFSFKTLLLAEHICALLCTATVPETIIKYAAGLGIEDMSTFETDGRLLDFVDAEQDNLWSLVIEEGYGMVSAAFITPEQASKMMNIIFFNSFGVFPSLVSWSETSNSLEKQKESIVAISTEMASNTLLSTAKALQDLQSPTIILPGFRDPVRLSPSFALLLFYLAFSIHPTPSSCNNIGILLSTIPWSERGSTEANSLARLFYERGLELDPNHPHILTNYGSLLKECNDLDGAIEMYKRAVEVNPGFGLGLSNLANAMKDSGYLTESVSIYRRAISVQPDLPEALCGLVHASWSIAEWRGFGFIDTDLYINDDGNTCDADDMKHTITQQGSHSWLSLLSELVQKQLDTAYRQNHGVVRSMGTLDDWLSWIEESTRTKMHEGQRYQWTSEILPYFSDREAEGLNEGGLIIRIIEWLSRHLQWRWYIEQYGRIDYASERVSPKQIDSHSYLRPHIPASLAMQTAPSILPFHAFSYPLSARLIRLISHRNALRVSHLALSRSWLPETIYCPPSPPRPALNIGYVSSDFIDHPTSHLMSSVFGNHDRSSFRIFAYSLSPSDGSQYSQKIAAGVDVFRDVSSWPSQYIVEQIVEDEIHILVNLNGYTKGARNDVFAARPSPLQISFLGFAGTLAAGWCDYIVCDPVVCPPGTRFCDICNLGDKVHSSHIVDVDSSESKLTLGPDPESQGDWTYTERFMYMPHTYLVTDHKQTHRDEAPGPQQWIQRERRRILARRSLFPDIFDDTIIFANFNQIYKLDPGLFSTWLRILLRVPNSILWILRFPHSGEDNLTRTARQWAGQEIAQRIRFTNTVRKEQHIERCALADIFLDTVECNAHTVAADVLWSGTPIITWPKYSHKMCSRVATSVAFATGYGHQMVTDSLSAYEERAVSLALSATPLRFGRRVECKGELEELRRNLFLNREIMPLFDCKRWTRNLEKGYKEAWKRWVKGGTTTHFEIEGRTNHQFERCNGFIWIRDE